MSSQRLEKLTRQMLGGAHSGGAKSQIARPRTSQRNKLLHVCCRHVIVDDQDVRREHELRNGFQVSQRAERHLVVQTRVNGDLGVGGHQRAVPSFGLSLLGAVELTGPDGVVDLPGKRLAGLFGPSVLHRAPAASRSSLPSTANTTRRGHSMAESPLLRMRSMRAE
jgi:hypothetical protein